MSLFDPNSVAYMSKHPRHGDEEEPFSDAIDVFLWGQKLKNPPHHACARCMKWDQKRLDRNGNEVRAFFPKSAALAERPPGSINRNSCDGCFVSFFDPDGDPAEHAAQAALHAEQWRETKAQLLELLELIERRRRHARQWKTWVESWKEHVERTAALAITLPQDIEKARVSLRSVKALPDGQDKIDLTRLWKARLRKAKARLKNLNPDLEPDPTKAAGQPRIPEAEKSFAKRERQALNTQQIKLQTKLQGLRQLCLVYNVDPTAALASGALLRVGDAS